MDADMNEMAEQLQGRIFNWKFESALQYLDGAKSEVTKRLVKTLATLFENEGWSSGLMSDLVGAVVSHIYVLEGWKDEEDEENETGLPGNDKPPQGPNAEAVQSLRVLAGELMRVSKELETTDMSPLEATQLVGKTLITIGEGLCGRSETGEGDRIPQSQYDQCKDCKGTAGSRHGHPGGDWKCCPPLSGPCKMYEKES